MLLGLAKDLSYGWLKGKEIVCI